MSYLFFGDHDVQNRTTNWNSLDISTFYLSFFLHNDCIRVYIYLNSIYGRNIPNQIHIPNAGMSNAFS